MAYTEFYMQTTGSNVNAGSTNADAASITQTNGSWDITADTFIATAGLPFAAVSVGDWASIYNDGATVTPYISQVTAVNSLGASITLSTTVKFGTKTAAGATGKSCKIGGAWADLGMTAASVALNTGTVPLSTRINVKAGTYASTTTARTLALAGATTTPLWWRGYNAAIGDLDADFTTAKPSITFTTGTLTASGTHQIFSNLSFVATTATSRTVNVTGAGIKFDRCRFDAQNASAAAYACTIGAATTRFSRCWFKATTTATQVVLSSFVTECYGCVFLGGGHGLTSDNANLIAVGCVFRSNGGDGIRRITGASGLVIVGCTFYAPTSDGIEMTVVPTTAQVAMIANCLFVSCLYDINNSSGTVTNAIHRAHNATYNFTSGHEFGFTDSPDFTAYTDSSSSVTSATDMTPVAGSNALAHGIPGLFEGESYTNYGPIGAVQPPQPSQALILTPTTAY